MFLLIGDGRIAVYNRATFTRYVIYHIWNLEVLRRDTDPDWLQSSTGARYAFFKIRNKSKGFPWSKLTEEKVL